MLRRSGVVKFYSQCKHLFVFEFELYIDAFRGRVLSAMSFFVFPLDVLLMRDPQSGSFWKVLNLGRRSERLLKLFGERRRAVQKAASAV